MLKSTNKYCVNRWKQWNIPRFHFFVHSSFSLSRLGGGNNFWLHVWYLHSSSPSLIYNRHMPCTFRTSRTWIHQFQLKVHLKVIPPQIVLLFSFYWVWISFLGWNPTIKSLGIHVSDTASTYTYAFERGYFQDPMAAFPSSFVPFLVISFGTLLAAVGVIVPGANGAKPRAFFVFGDSLVDSGNNNYLATTARADSPPYGIDYPTGRPTGRFSNGLNIPDLISSVSYHKLFTYQFFIFIH